MQWHIQERSKERRAVLSIDSKAMTVSAPCAGMETRERPHPRLLAAQPSAVACCS